MKSPLTRKEHFKNQRKKPCLKLTKIQTAQGIISKTNGYIPSWDKQALMMEAAL